MKHSNDQVQLLGFSIILQERNTRVTFSLTNNLSILDIGWNVTSMVELNAGNDMTFGGSIWSDIAFCQSGSFASKIQFCVRNQKQEIIYTQGHIHFCCFNV